MSIWTHVNGNIRVDSFRFDEAAEEKRIRDALGEIITYDHIGLFGNSLGDCPEIRIPCGSEGSLEYEIIANPDKSCIAAYSISVWGDLRSYCDTNEIEAWFNRVVYESDLSIRQAILQVEVEGMENRVFVYDESQREDTPKEMST